MLEAALDPPKVLLKRLWPAGDVFDSQAPTKELQTVITFELRCFSPIPTLFLIVVTSALFWYLSWARRVRVAPDIVVTDTHTHYDYCNLAPAWARLTKTSRVQLHSCQQFLYVFHFSNEFQLG